MVKGSLQRQGKNLLIFDLNGVLGHFESSNNQEVNQSIYAKGQEVKPIFRSASQGSLYARPFLNQVNFKLLIQ